MPLSKYKEQLGDKFDEANAIAKGFKDEVVTAQNAQRVAEKSQKTAEKKLETAESDLAAAREGDDDKLQTLTRERDEAKEALQTATDAHETTKRGYSLWEAAQAHGLQKRKYLALLDTAGLEPNDKGGFDIPEDTVKAWKESDAAFFTPPEQTQTRVTGGGREDGSVLPGVDNNTDSDAKKAGSAMAKQALQGLGYLPQNAAQQ